MGELREIPTAYSLPDELQRQTADPRLTAFMEVTLKLDLPDTAVFSPIQTHHISAILAEALSNVARHAQARHVQVKARQNSQQFQLSIHDDGRGFDPAAAAAAGYGLSNMRDRARLLGGNLHIQSEPNQGTTVMLTFAPEGPK
jgi:signal transduction histidine kinase